MRLETTARLALLLAAATLATACAAQGPVAAGPTSRAAIESLVGEAPCDADAQCRTVGVGAKACGGPARYLAWSSRHTDAAALQRAVEQDARRARADAEAAGILSNCSIAVDPGASCVRQRCQLRPRGPGGAGAID